jgi:hypothetical protein
VLAELCPQLLCRCIPMHDVSCAIQFRVSLFRVASNRSSHLENINKQFLLLYNNSLCVLLLCPSHFHLLHLIFHLLLYYTFLNRSFRFSPSCFVPGYRIKIAMSPTASVFRDVSYWSRAVLYSSSQPRYRSAATAWTSFKINNALTIWTSFKSNTKIVISIPYYNYR